MKLLTWNLEWARPGSERERVVKDELLTADADIICLTEAYAETLPPGHIIEAGRGNAVADKKGAKKVLLWSREGWSSVSTEPALSPPGRAIRGVTATEFGPTKILGVCIPWAGSNTARYGGDRSPWDDHLDFVRALATRLRGVSGPMIVLGDFNQRLPRRRQPEHVALALEQALANMKVPTRNFVGADGDLAIDHIAHTADLRTEQLEELPKYLHGLRLSDHFGVVATITAA